MPPTETSDQTIQRVLSTYDIAAKLKSLRLRKKIALKDLGKHSGLSASLLSQLETGKATPTLATLARIAMVFEVGIDYFFTNPSKPRRFSIVRKNERMRFPEKPEAASPGYFFECLAFPIQDKSMQAYYAEFPAGAAAMAEPHSHDGAELLYVTGGIVEVSFAGAWHSLEQGDAVYMDSGEPHGYRGGENGGSAIVVTLPPVAPA